MTTSGLFHRDPQVRSDSQKLGVTAGVSLRKSADSHITIRDSASSPLLTISDRRSVSKSGPGEAVVRASVKDGGLLVWELRSAVTKRPAYLLETYPAHVTPWSSARFDRALRINFGVT